MNIKISYNRFIVLILVVIASSLIALNVQAAGLIEGIDEARTLASRQKLFLGDAQQVIRTVIKFILGLSGIVAVLAVVYAGFLYITSFGDEKKTETAKKIIFYVVVGLIIMGVSAIVVNVIINLL